MNTNKSYRMRKICPHCFSLSIKKSYKIFKCDNCKKDFEEPFSVMLLHINNRCIDNDISSRKERMKDNIIQYNEA